MYEDSTQMNDIGGCCPTLTIRLIKGYGEE